MKPFRLVKSLIPFLFIFQAVSHAAPSFTPVAPQVDASAYIVMDYHSGRVLAALEPEKIIEPASLTKMMTIYVIDHELRSGGIKLDDMVRISENAWHTQGSRMFAEVGKSISVKDLIDGVVIASGNDASVALAEHVAGTELAFAALMNQHAKRLGMHHTNFMNATGWPDPQHLTTVHDLGLLAQALIRDFPESYSLYSQKWFDFNGIKQPNRNQLLWRDQSVDGVKTGHSEAAGYCLTASAKRDNMRLISVLVGAKSDNSRSQGSQSLLNFGFRFFESHPVFSANKILEKQRIYMGSKKFVTLGVLQDLYITLPRGQYRGLETTLNINNHLKAPLKKGEAIGTIIVKMGSQIVSTQPLVALEDIEKGGVFGRLTDFFSLTFKKLFNKQTVVTINYPPADSAAPTLT
jgi:D-alanyl-D-alanine carboxypeptidase (penicillin-binding protein 5/6)